MTQEEIDLLIKDLSARLLCGVKVSITAHNLDYEKDFGKTIIADLVGIHTAKDDEGTTHTCFITCYDEYKTQGNDIETIKPYLRPLSSMTEEEFGNLKVYSELEYDQLEMPEWDNGYKTLEFWLEEVPSYVVILVFDWLNKNHFDYRGLIPIGLAIAVTEENNPYK